MDRGAWQATAYEAVESDTTEQTHTHTHTHTHWCSFHFLYAFAGLKYFRMMKVCDLFQNIYMQVHGNIHIDDIEM